MLWNIYVGDGDDVYDDVCVFIPSPVREISTFFVADHRGSILLNRAETSQEG